MQLKQGMIVSSDAGHDQNRFYVIVKVCGDFFYIADGKRRKLEKPKRKNQRHLTRTNRFLEEEMYQSNQKIRRALSGLNNSLNAVAD